MMLAMSVATEFLPGMNFIISTVTGFRIVSVTEQSVMENMTNRYDRRVTKHKKREFLK